MIKFTTKCANLEMHVIYSRDKAVCDQDLDHTMPTVIIHEREPALKATLVMPNQSLAELETFDFIEYRNTASTPSNIRHSPNSDMCGRGGKLNNVGTFEDLIRIVDEYEACEKFGTNPPKEYRQSVRKIDDYFQEIFGHLTSDQESFVPFKCGACNNYLDLTYLPNDGIDFGIGNIKGQRFFSCPECKKAVSKIEMIRSVIQVLDEYKQILHKQLDYFNGEKEMVKVAEKKVEKEVEKEVEIIEIVKPKSLKRSCEEGVCSFKKKKF